MENAEAGPPGSSLASLGRIALFADLSRPELSEVDRILDEEFFDEGRRIVRRGIGGSNFYVIVEGEATAAIGGEDIEQLSVGDYFGDDALLLGESPAYDVVAAAPLTCRVLSGAYFERFMASHPMVMYRMLQREALRRRRASGAAS